MGFRVEDGGDDVLVQRSTGRMVVAGTAIVSLVLMGWSVVAAGDMPYRAAGTGYPGLADALGYVLLRAVAQVSGALTLGSLVYAVCGTAPGERGQVGVDGYAGIRIAERASVVWLLSALALIPVAAAQAGGMSTATLFRLGALGALIDASEKPRAWIVVAVLAAVITLVIRITLSWNGCVVLLVLSAIAVLPAPLVGNAGEGPDHDYGTGAMILFQIAISVVPGLLWCVAAQVNRGGADATAGVRRATVITRVCLITATLSGLVLVLVLLPWSAVFGTGYGRLALLAGIAGVGIAAQLRGTAKGFLITCAAGLSVLAHVAIVAMAVRPAPAPADRTFTAQQVFLGFDLPDPPDVLRLITFWRFDIVLGSAAIAGAALYVVGVLRLRRRGDHWSPLRTLSWLTGCLVLLIATSSGLSAYGYAMFSFHMIQHMTLNMFIPVLLVLGAPVTLLLRAVSPAPRGTMPGVREWVLSVLHSKPTAVLAHPATALSAFVVSLYGLYFTPIFDGLIRYHWGHVLMNVHFLIIGYLFYWGIIGIDPGPRRLPHLGRLGMLFAIMPFHAFFGVAVMSMTTVIGQRFYSQLEPAWPIDLLSDQRTGGGIAWISGEVPVLLVVGALLTQWVAQDRRTALRTDRRDDEYGDSEFAAYNAMLEQLARNRR